MSQTICILYIFGTDLPVIVIAVAAAAAITKNSDDNKNDNNFKYSDKIEIWI